MHSVRTGFPGWTEVLDRVLPRAAVHGPKWDRPPPDGDLLVLDIVYVLGIIALFVLVGVIGKAVEKL